MTNSEKVREFAETATKSHLPDGSFLPPLPSTAIPMDKESVKNIVKMVFDECVELLVTVTTSEIEQKEILEDIINNIKFRKALDSSWKSVEKIVEDQIDAFVDIEYYIKDRAGRHGMNIDKIFDLVHEANMNKRLPNGEFLMREDGKVLKPDGWKSANIQEEIHKQINVKSI